MRHAVIVIALAEDLLRATLFCSLRLERRTSVWGKQVLIRLPRDRTWCCVVLILSNLNVKLI
jgi:hypothetical protein